MEIIKAQISRSTRMHNDATCLVKRITRTQNSGTLDSHAILSFPASYFTSLIMPEEALGNILIQSNILGKFQVDNLDNNDTSLEAKNQDPARLIKLFWKFGNLSMPVRYLAGSDRYSVHTIGMPEGTLVPAFSVPLEFCERTGQYTAVVRVKLSEPTYNAKNDGLSLPVICEVSGVAQKMCTLSLFDAGSRDECLLYRELLLPGEPCRCLRCCNNLNRLEDQGQESCRCGSCSSLGIDSKTQTVPALVHFTSDGSYRPVKKEKKQNQKLTTRNPMQNASCRIDKSYGWSGWYQGRKLVPNSPTMEQSAFLDKGGMLMDNLVLTPPYSGSSSQSGFDTSLDQLTDVVGVPTHKHQPSSVPEQESFFSTTISQFEFSQNESIEDEWTSANPDHDLTKRRQCVPLQWPNESYDPDLDFEWPNDFFMKE